MHMWTTSSVYVYSRGSHSAKIAHLGSLQMHPKCDTGAGDDFSQEPWPHAALYHADHGHNEETGKKQMQGI